jgi:CheY-specific phosphatase CheX
MFSQYFGQYLLNKGILTSEKLSDVLAYERSVHVKLGVLAISAGMMNAAQVEEVHELQRIKDKRFGEIAIERGYLTFAQLEDLLQQQGSRQLSLSQAIIDREYMTLAGLEAALESYKRDNSLSKEQLDAIKTVDFDRLVRAFLDFSEAGGLSEAYYDYVALILRSIMRFLNEVPVISRNIPLEGKVQGWTVVQDIIGEIDLATAIAAEDTALLEIARRYSQEDLKEIDELAKDSMAEFLNLANGIYCVNASDKGLELNLEPQSVASSPEFAHVKGSIVPIDLPFGKIKLVVGQPINK